MAGSAKVLGHRAATKHGDGLVREFAYFIQAMKSLADPYRPELHYMRGPGPKWHAKHNPTRQTIGNHAGLASAKG